MDDPIFKLEPTGKVTVDKRKTVSSRNSLKNFKYADLPSHCDMCLYRSEDDGGNGKCDKYEKGAVCAYRKDIDKFLTEVDTRKPEDLRAMLDHLAKDSFKSISMMKVFDDFDGGQPSRAQTQEFNKFINVVKLANELNQSTIKLSQKEEYDADGGIKSLFKELESRKSSG